MSPTAKRDTPHPEPPRPAAPRAAFETRLRWIARAAFTVTLLSLVAWFLVVVIEAPLTPVVVLGLVASVTLLIRLARLQAVARR